MHKKRSVRSAFAVLVATALVASMVGIVPAGAAEAQRGEAPKLPTRVSAGALDLTGAKLDSRLAELASTAGRTGDAAEAIVEIAVLASKGADAPAEMIRPLRMNLRGDPDNDLWVGTAKVGRLLKIASGKDVQFVYENGRREPEAAPDSGGGGAGLTDAEIAENAAEVQAALAAAREAGAPEKFIAQFDEDGVLVDPIDAPDGDSSTGFFDVLPSGHDSVGAWDQGYTGSGVRVAVADDSADFGHPDLQGTAAVIDDAASPYDGWPQAFDPFSLLLYAYDSFYGMDYVASGSTWFSDTSAEMAEGDPAGFDGEDVVTPGNSLSGTYHMGYLWDENYYYFWGSGSFPMVLVSDPNTAGVYDTVYVDLDGDFDFSNNKASTKSDPYAWMDLWGEYYDPTPDGMADISGGMVYWVADGTNQPPGAEFLYGTFPTTPGAGDMVCFMGALNVNEDHGTLCSSNVVGQGVSDAASVWGDYPPFKTEGDGTGIVQGAAPDAGLVAIADIYWNHFSSTLAAYDYAAFGLDNTPGTGDDCQIVSNSYGESDEDADGWDYRSRYITYLNEYWNPFVAYLFSTGNGAPGYGTNAPPSASTAIAIGASTQMGACGGWDSIYDADQVTVGDVIPWSNRGPGADGGLAPDVVADGAYSSGAVPTNMYWYDGAGSWDVWGGTSRSCPVAAGNLALVFQAYADNHGGWPDYETAKQLLMNGARDLNYDTLVQGAGSVDANRSVGLAAGNFGVAVSPSYWEPGDYLGERYDSFANVVHAGESYSTEFEIHNVSGSTQEVSMEDAVYRQTSSTSLTIELDPAELDPYDDAHFSFPDYVTEITDIIPAGTDLMVIRTTQDITDFAPTGAFSTGSTNHNVWRPLVYDWTDQDDDGEIWFDSNDNGFVNIDEMDEGEFMRFTYHNNFANTHEIRVQTPLDRMHDGVFLGAQLARRDAGGAVTSMEFEITFWDRQDCGWLDADGSVTLDPGWWWTPTITLDVPADTPVGIYEASVRVTGDAGVTVVPVVINVAADDYSFSFGDVGGTDEESLMDNERVFGGQDWAWRPESGDWRFFWTDGSAAPDLPDGAAWLVRTVWPDSGAPDGYKTDLDTLLYGPTMDVFSAFDSDLYGPYALGLAGGSANTNIGAGIWTFQTNSGTTEEWVAGSLTAGLNQVMIHNVLYDGAGIGTPFTGETGVISVSPSRLDIVSREDAGAEAIEFTTYDLPLTGATAQAYGLSKRVEETRDITTGESEWFDISLDSAAYLDIQTACVGQDIDLYLYWFDGSDWWMVGASETSSGDENIHITMPPDGPYMAEVYGYSITDTQPFDMTISSPMGNDMTLSGIPAGGIDAGGGFTLDVDWTKVHSAPLQEREGEFEGVIFLGPVEAPSAVQVPVTLRYPFEVESSTPASDTVVTDRYTPVSVTFSKRVDQATLDGTTFSLMKGTDAVSGTIVYDDLTATAEFVPDSPLENLSGYELVIAEVWSVDGDVLSATIPFTTDFSIRSAGPDRYGTAVETSQRNFESADTVVLATGELFPDALAASGLAGVYGGPLLLTRTDALPAIVADEIGRLGAENVIIVGGPVAVSADVEDAVDALAGVSVERVFGGDRYETAAKVARRMRAELGNALPETCFLARGDDFADALSLSPYAYSQKIPILLTQPDVMPGVTSSAIDDLGFTEMLIAGETSAVSIAAASGASVANVYRAGGADRYETAAEVASYAVSRAWASWHYVGVATGEQFPDGLTGGAATGSRNGVLLLTPADDLHDATEAAIAAEASTIGTLQIFGGSAAISEAVVAEISALLP